MPQLKPHTRIGDLPSSSQTSGAFCAHRARAPAAAEHKMRVPLERTGPAERRTKCVKLSATFLHHGSWRQHGMRTLQDDIQDARSRLANKRPRSPVNAHTVCALRPCGPRGAQPARVRRPSPAGCSPRRAHCQPCSGGRRRHMETGSAKTCAHFCKTQAAMPSGPVALSARSSFRTCSAHADVGL